MLRPFRTAALAAALGACVPIPGVPQLTPTQDAAVRTTLAAATNPRSSVGIPPRPCPEHTARSEPGGKCKPLPCGGQCREGQRCDEAALVPRCVPR